MARERRHVPLRRCIGCGRRAAKHELLRVAVSRESGVATAVPDPRTRLPGRGAYLCRGAGPAGVSAACLQRANRRQGFSRALRARVSAGPELVESK